MLTHFTVRIKMKSDLHVCSGVTCAKLTRLARNLNRRYLSDE